MIEWWYVTGMASPYWSVMQVENYPGQGDVTTIAHNAEADTDMADLYDDEFYRYFPWAFPITKEQFDARSIDGDDAIGYVKQLYAEGKLPYRPGDLPLSSITCPVCHRTSYNANDIEFSYCGNCHWWTGNPRYVKAASTQPSLSSLGKLVLHGPQSSPRTRREL